MSSKRATVYHTPADADDLHLFEHQADVIKNWAARPARRRQLVAIYCAACDQRVAQLDQILFEADDGGFYEVPAVGTLRLAVRRHTTRYRDAADANRANGVTINHRVPDDRDLLAMIDAGTSHPPPPVIPLWCPTHGANAGTVSVADLRSPSRPKRMKGRRPRR